MPNLVHGQDPGGGLRPIQVDDNGNLQIDLVSGVSVSTSITGTMTVDQLSGSNWSQNVLQLGGTAIAVDSGVAGAGVMRVVHVTDVAASVRAIANSGVDIGDVDVLSIAAGDNNIGDMDVRQISGSVDSINVLQIAGTDVAVNSGIANAGTLRVVHVTDSALSAVATGDVASDGVDAGSPVKVGGQARTTNPTAVADADRVNFTADDLGRQVITPYQVRDLVVTAYVVTTTGIETALLAGAASTFHDLVHIIAANTSDAVVDVDIRFGTAGTIIGSLTIPADATSGFVPTVPIPMSEVAQAVTVDVGGSDVSNTTVNFTGLFIKNV